MQAAAGRVESGEGDSYLVDAGVGDGDLVQRWSELRRRGTGVTNQRPAGDPWLNSEGCAAAARFRISATSCVMAVTRAW